MPGENGYMMSLPFLLAIASTWHESDTHVSKQLGAVKRGSHFPPMRPSYINAEDSKPPNQQIHENSSLGRWYQNLLEM